MAKSPKKSVEEWPDLMIVPPAWKMDAEILQPDIERLIQMFKTAPESRWIEVSKIILGGKWDTKPDSRELMLYLRTKLSPEDVADYQAAMEQGPFMEWLQTLPDTTAERFVQWRFGFEVQSEAAREAKAKGKEAAV